MIRKITEEDLSQLDVIEQACFQDPYRIDQYEYEINDNPVANLYGYEVDGELVGFIDFWITFEACQLTKIAVLKEYRNQKIGSKLMDFMVDYAIEQDCEAIFLEVRKSNLVAQKFYDGYDFMEMNVRKAYYSDNDEDAIVMGKVIGGLK